MKPATARLIIVLAFLAGYYLLPTWYYVLGPGAAWLRRWG